MSIKKERISRSIVTYEHDINTWKLPHTCGKFELKERIDSVVEFQYMFVDNQLIRPDNGFGSDVFKYAIPKKYDYIITGFHTHTKKMDLQIFVVDGITDFIYATPIADVVDGIITMRFGDMGDGYEILYQIVVRMCELTPES